MQCRNKPFDPRKVYLTQRGEITYEYKPVREQFRWSQEDLRTCYQAFLKITQGMPPSLTPATTTEPSSSPSYPFKKANYLISYQVCDAKSCVEDTTGKVRRYTPEQEETLRWLLWSKGKSGSIYVGITPIPTPQNTNAVLATVIVMYDIAIVHHDGLPKYCPYTRLSDHSAQVPFERVREAIAKACK